MRIVNFNMRIVNCNTSIVNCNMRIVSCLEGVMSFFSISVFSSNFFTAFILEIGYRGTDYTIKTTLLYKLIEANGVNSGHCNSLALRLS